VQRVLDERRPGAADRGEDEVCALLRVGGQDVAVPNVDLEFRVGGAER
jgi:hypothetical protein